MVQPLSEIDNWLNNDKKLEVVGKRNWKFVSKSMQELAPVSVSNAQ